jgi:transcriptional regulator with XRE-family HTH domain
MINGREDNPFASMLRSLRFKIGKSMGQVAREIGVTTVYYSEVENAKAPPPYIGGKVDFDKLAEAVGGDVQALMMASSMSRRRMRLDLDLGKAPEGKRSVAIGLARRLKDDSLTEEQLEQIREVLEGK